MHGTALKFHQYEMSQNVFQEGVVVVEVTV
jgi:hypothetical protein